MSCEVYNPQSGKRTVKNLRWFFEKARGCIIDKILMQEKERPGHGWKMTAWFDDGTIFETDYADLSVFKDVMGRHRSLHGVKVVVLGQTRREEIVLGSKSKRR